MKKLDTLFECRVHFYERKIQNKGDNNDMFQATLSKTCTWTPTTIFKKARKQIWTQLSWKITTKNIIVWKIEP